MSAHVVPRKIYYAIFVTLMLLTWATVQIAFVDLGLLNSIIALTIAVIKATLVVLFFMHVRYSSRLTQIVIVAGIFWLGILIVLTMGDYPRSNGPRSNGWLQATGCGLRARHARRRRAAGACRLPWDRRENHA